MKKNVMNKKRESCCNKEKWIGQIRKQGELLKQIHRWRIGRGEIGITKMKIRKKIKIWWKPRQMPPLAGTMKTWDKRVEVWMWKKRNWGPKLIIPQEGLSNMKMKNMLRIKNMAQCEKKKLRL
jgi:hypothetical protein